MKAANHISKYKTLSTEYLDSLKPSYTSQDYPIPKWIIFSQTLIKDGWVVRLYRAKTTFSKYLFISRDKKMLKIRFSNHKANKLKELANDCDFYVGVGNKGVITTEELLRTLLAK